MDPTVGYFSQVHIDPHPYKNGTYVIDGVLEYTWKVNGVTQRLTLPRNFEFDGASVPSWATFLSDVLPFVDKIETFGRHVKAAAFHDFIWMYKGRLPEGCHVAHLDGVWKDVAYDFNTGKPVWGFTTSNKLFSRHLRELGISAGTRRAMYWAVSSPIGYINWRTGRVPDDARPKKL